MNTTAIVFPFDLFGSGGCGAGAVLLADALREIIADGRQERTPTRALAYAHQVRIREYSFATLNACKTWRERGRRVARRVLRSGDFLIWMTGNHLGTLPVYEELGRLDGKGLVIQMDAHLDIQSFSTSTPELSHGNFLLHLKPPAPRIVNAGHRDLLLKPETVERYYCRALSAEAIARDTEEAVSRIGAAARDADHVLLDVDCDVLDPAFFPAVSHPVPFGLSPQVLFRFLDAAWSEKVVGLAFSEFDPGRDHDDRSLAILVWLLERLLLMRHEPGRA